METINRQTKDDLINWICKVYKEIPYPNSDSCSLVIGISGNMDSAVTAALCAEAVGADRIIGVIMPCGKDGNKYNAVDICNYLNINYIEADITDSIKQLKNCYHERKQSRLYVEAEEDDVAVLHDVFLALRTDETLLLRRRHRAAGDEVVKRDHLRADKAALKVGVDLSCRLGRLGTLLDRPGAHLRLTGGEVGDQPQQAVALVDQTVETALLQPEIAEEHFLLFLVHLDDLRLHLGTDRQHACILLCGESTDAL